MVRQAALRRHETGDARIVPIILRPCLWQESPFGKLQALPTDAKPLTQWRDRDEACLEVARGVMAIVDELAGVREAVASNTATNGPAHNGLNIRLVRTAQRSVSVTILLTSSGVSYEVELPCDILVRHLIPELLHHLGVSDRLASGHPVWFELTSNALGRALEADLTIRQNNVPEGDTLSLVGKFTGG